MSPNDIVVGQKYRNHHIPNHIYLGAHKYFGSDLGDSEKILVVVEAPYRLDNVGRVVCDPIFCVDGYWDAFYVDEGETVE